ncbi:sulfite exporter TauE/SafE family protein [Devosia sp.]|uniref:sulfite exporter TauE/SafE family protein n=1 Tax=Devosia sp. TaxID=1871048 RepID=UPI003264A149
MSIWIGVGMLVAVFCTSMLSGIFGMAGGLILLWLLFLLLPVGTAIAVHGVIQIVSNGSRAWFSRQYIDWKILGIISIGLFVSAGALSLVNYRPDLFVASITIGLMPILVWIPTEYLALDASKPHHAFIAGIVSGTFNIGAGVSGPTVDIFFIRTMMDRRKIIATKAATQVVSHGIKVLFYWQAAQTLNTGDWTAILIAAPFAIVGTSAGNWVLQKLSDANFRKYTRFVVTVIGLFYLGRALLVLL